ncbi:MAG: YciI family protein [Hyphomicrobiales bacterium]|nr:YciI family protein [Hyphomicrobiales bacterium]
MLFVIHALDKAGAMPTRAKHYRDHRIHLDRAEDHHVDVITAGTLLAEDGETPCGSVFVIDAANRAAVERFVRSDPYHVNAVWERAEIHGYNKKRGTPIVSRRA